MSFHSASPHLKHHLCPFRTHALHLLLLHLLGFALVIPP
jgi:hypothetical protein